jgi:hypothetical protein
MAFSHGRRRVSDNIAGARHVFVIEALNMLDSSGTK